MAIAVVGIGVEQSNRTTITPTWPAAYTPTTGHVAVIQVDVMSGDPGAGFSTTTDISPPSGFTQIGKNDNALGYDGFSTDHYVFRRVLAGGETFTAMTNPHTGAYIRARVTVFSGVDNTTPEDATSVASSAASQTAWQPTGITTVTNGAYVLSYFLNPRFYHSPVAAGHNINGFTLGYSSIKECAVAFAYIERATAGAQTMPTWAADTDGVAGISIALRPAGGGGSTNYVETGRVVSISTIVQVGDSHNVPAVFTNYTELEWSIGLQSPAVNTNVFEFRVYAGSLPLDTYLVTPQLTAGTGAGGVNYNETGRVVAVTAEVAETDQADFKEPGRQVAVVAAVSIPTDQADFKELALPLFGGAAFVHGPFVLANITSIGGGTPSVTAGALSSSWGGYGRLIFRPDARNAGDCYFEIITDRTMIDTDDWWGMIVNAASNGNGGMRVMIKWNDRNPATGAGAYVGPSDDYGTQVGTVTRINPDPAGWTNAGPHSVGIRHLGSQMTIVLDGIDVYQNTNATIATYTAGGYVGFGGDSSGATRTWTTWALGPAVGGGGGAVVIVTVTDQLHAHIQELGLVVAGVAATSVTDQADFKEPARAVAIVGIVTVQDVLAGAPINYIETGRAVAIVAIVTVSDHVAIAAGVDQEGFRWRNDDGSEVAATWRAAQDTNVLLKVDTTSRLRLLLDATGNPDPAAYKLFFKKTTDSTWAAVPVGSGGGSAVYIPTSSHIATSGEDTTPQLTPPAGKTTGAFITGRIWDDENGIDEIDLGPLEGPVEMTLQVGATSFVPWVQLQPGSTATVTWTNSSDTTITTGLKPTITSIPTDRIIRLYVTDDDDLPAMNEVDSFNIGFNNDFDTGEDAIGAAYNHPGQPVTNIEGLQLLSEMRYFMADSTPLNCDLNFAGMNNLEFIECFQSDVTAVVMTGCTSLIRLCLEGCSITHLDLSTIKNNLKDLRCADNRPNPLTFTCDGQLTAMYHYCVRDQKVTAHLSQALMPVVRQYWAWGTGTTTVPEGFDNTGAVSSMQVLLHNNPLDATSVDRVINSLAATGAVSGLVNMEDADYPTTAASTAHATLGTRGWARNYPAINGGSNLDGTWPTPTHVPWVAGDLTGGTFPNGTSGGPVVTGGVLAWHITSFYGTTLMRPATRSAGPVFFEVAIDRPGGTDGFNYWWALAVNCNSSGNGGLRVFLHWPEMNDVDGTGIEIGASDNAGSPLMGGSILRIASNPSGWDTPGQHKVGLAAAGRRLFITFDGVKVFKAQRNIFITDFYAGGYVGIAGGVVGENSRTFHSWGLSNVTL